VDRLTDREQDVLTLMAQGRSNQSISENLFLSPKPSKRTSAPSSR
jgi:DNA-binding NarL/FixJ family response regulator